MSNASVLLVEDNKRVNIANRDMLELMGYGVDISETIAEARASLTDKTPDVVVLDIMMPDGSGLDFLLKLRQNAETARIPVIILTALGTPDNIVNGLSAGADDYLAKPYEYKVLSARIEALLRRSEIVPDQLTKGALTVDVTARRAFLQGKDLLLKPKEFDVLLYFVRNEGMRVRAETLYLKVWRRGMASDDNAVKSQISSLRKKLAGSGYTITNERGEGYCFERE